MIAPSGNGSFPSRKALIATSLPRTARKSLRFPSSWATEINFQLRYPGGTLPLKTGDASSSACPGANRTAASATAMAITRILSGFIVCPLHGQNAPAGRLSPDATGPDQCQPDLLLHHPLEAPI